MLSLKTISKWLVLSRWWSYITDFIAVTVGSMLALPEFNTALYIAMLIGTISLNAFANFMNDIHDFKKGEGWKNRAKLKQPNPIASRAASIADIRAASILALGIAVLSGTYLIMYRGIAILLLGSVGIAAAYFYSAGKSIKSLALGEVLVFTIFGPIMTIAAYYVESGRVSPAATAMSVIVGILIMLVLLANNIRDIKIDREAGARTIAILLGRDKSMLMFYAFMALAYLLFVMLVAAGVLPLLSLIALASAIPAIRLCISMHANVSKNSAELVARIAFFFSVLFSIGMIVQQLTLL